MDPERIEISTSQRRAVLCGRRDDAKGDRIRRDDELGAVLFRNLSDLRGLALEEAEVRGILDVDGGRLFRDLLLQVVEVQEPGLLIEPHGDDREVRLQVVGDDEERLPGSSSLGREPRGGR